MRKDNVESEPTFLEGASDSRSPGGASRLEIVHLEANEHDSKLVEEQLEKGGLDVRLVRVETAEAFQEQIKRPELDLILAALDCPDCEGFHALALAREQRPNVPFVFVSKTLDHDDAVESLSAGVTDFIFKQHLPQLVPAVRRIMREGQARRELSSAQEHLIAQAELLDLANDSIILCDARDAITYWNCGSQRIYGWTEEEALGQKIHTLLKTQFSEGASDLEETLCAQSHWEGELQQIARDGRTVHVASHWTLKSESRDPHRLLINTDISARKKAEEDLRQSEERLRRFVEEDLTGNLIIRPDGAIVTCNPAFVRIFDLGSVNQALTTNFMSLLRSPHDGAELLSMVQAQRTVERHDLEMRQPSGDLVYVVARFVGFFGKEGELVEMQGYLFNDTKRRRLEQQLAQAQKMEGLGTLAGGIAHDFNNILAIILGYTTQLEKRAARPEQVVTAIKVIKEAVARGAALVQQLLTSARQAEAHFSALDLNALISELERMLQATFPKMINFKLQLQPNLPPLTADRSQIHQVLLNLCVNARDAMPDGGTITVETQLTTGEELRQSFAGADAERYICILVQDTGAGMTPEVEGHIFEPFFTTKERAKGTGLGLSVVYGVVNNHNGFIQVESEPNVGTTFSVHLPVRHSPEHVTGTPRRTRRYTRKPQTILLVEDEEMLRDLGVEVLQAEGYRVLVAKDGLEAVEIFAANRDAIGLVVCDLGLPKLGGRDVFLRMKEIKPSVRAIVASGYLEPALRSEILKAGVLDTIQKPYDLHELLEKIQAVIGKAHIEDDHPQLF